MDQKQVEALGTLANPERIAEVARKVTDMINSEEEGLSALEGVLAIFLVGETMLLNWEKAGLPANLADMIRTKMRAVASGDKLMEEE